MFDPAIQVGLHLAAAWGAGSLIGAERTHNGRAAGLRTHALVALAAAAAMFTAMGAPALTLGIFPAGDTTRVAQGVMTGVGFLGAGVIFKEGVSVQGLTTAASVWSTAAIGLLFGAGLFGPGVLVTVAVLATLVLFRTLERVVTGPINALAVFRFHAETAPSEDSLCGWLDPKRAGLSDVSIALVQGGALIEYRGNLRILRPGRLTDIVERLRGVPGLVEYDLSRISK